MKDFCSRNECNNEASMECPICQKNNLNASSHFCSQDCYKKAWPTHKFHHPGVYDPFPGFKFTGSLRPWPYGPEKTVPEHIPRPDYAADGIPRSEMDLRNKAATTIPVLTKEEQEAMRVVCRLSREVLDEAGKAIKVGVTGEDIDKIVHEATIKRNAYPSPLNYQGFPRSCCISVNEVICHGIPDTRPFAKGDIVNVDVSIFYGGFHGDLNETYIVKGENKGKEGSSGNDETTTTVAGETAAKLVECARESLRKAIEEVRPGIPYKELGVIIEKHVRSCGFSSVKSFCGHGVGRLFHGPPSVPHYAKNRVVGVIRAGHCFTIEPMINVGAWQEVLWPDNWTAVTVDGKKSAQFEHTLLVTETGCEVLTAAPGEKRFYQ